MFNKSQNSLRALEIRTIQLHSIIVYNYATVFWNFSISNLKHHRVNSRYFRFISFKLLTIKWFQEFVNSLSSNNSYPCQCAHSIHHIAIIVQNYVQIDKQFYGWFVPIRKCNNEALAVFIDVWLTVEQFYSNKKINGIHWTKCFFQMYRIFFTQGLFWVMEEHFNSQEIIHSMHCSFQFVFFFSCHFLFLNYDESWC